MLQGISQSLLQNLLELAIDTAYPGVEIGVILQTELVYRSLYYFKPFLEADDRVSTSLELTECIDHGIVDRDESRCLALQCGNCESEIADKLNVLAV